MVSATSGAPTARRSASSIAPRQATTWLQTLLSHGDRCLRQFEEDAGDWQQAADLRQNGARLLEITTYQVTGGCLDDGRRTG
jgi:hypothetical protein